MIVETLITISISAELSTIARGQQLFNEEHISFSNHRQNYRPKNGAFNDLYRYQQSFTNTGNNLNSNHHNSPHNSNNRNPPNWASLNPQYLRTRTQQRRDLPVETLFIKNSETNNRITGKSISKNSFPHFSTNGWRKNQNYNKISSKQRSTSSAVQYKQQLKNHHTELGGSSQLISGAIPPPPPPQFLPAHFLEHLPALSRQKKLRTRPTTIISPRFSTTVSLSSSSSLLSTTPATTTSHQTPMDLESKSAIQVMEPYGSINNTMTANDIFLKCCREKDVDTICESRCNFEALSRRVLAAMFIGSDSCPQRNGRSLISCAAQDSDYTECCRAKEVHRTSAGDKCLGFCQMMPDSEFQVDISMLPCWNVLSDIKECFKSGITSKYISIKAS